MDGRDEAIRQSACLDSTKVSRFLEIAAEMLRFCGRLHGVLGEYSIGTILLGSLINTPQEQQM